MFMHIGFNLNDRFTLREWSSDPYLPMENYAWFLPDNETLEFLNDTTYDCIRFVEGIDHHG
jgi:hypothetical protein